MSDQHSIHYDLIKGTWIGERHQSAIRAAFMSNILHRMLENLTFESFFSMSSVERAIQTEFVRKTKEEIDRYRIKFDPIPKRLIKQEVVKRPIISIPIQPGYIGGIDYE